MTNHPQRGSTLPTHFCISIEGLLRLFFIAFGLGYSVILWFSFLLDYLFAYPMCEICLLQRFLMFLIVLSSIIGGLVVSRTQRLGYVFLCANGLLVGLGLTFAVAHLHMMQTMISGGASACQVVSEMAFIPDFLSEYFHAHYAFVPCDQVKSGFLGLSFPMWSLLIYGASAIVFSLVVYLVVTQFRSRSFVARIREARWFAWCHLVFTMVLVILCVWISASIYVIMNQRNIIYRPERYTMTPTCSSMWTWLITPLILGHSKLMCFHPKSTCRSTRRRLMLVSFGLYCQVVMPWRSMVMLVRPIGVVYLSR